ncbi:MAG TPA: hypothetical protein VMI54_19190, partial [Polyangiaceae bacterium]|nr:hypothetical protein [Polyangiaceae bacterium]
CGSDVHGSPVAGEACGFQISTTSGRAVDPALLSVLIVGPGSSSTLMRVDASACTAAGDEWYFDTDTNTLVLCPSTCSALASSPESMLQILAACAPV